jgi:hypothetical protein
VQHQKLDHCRRWRFAAALIDREVPVGLRFAVVGEVQALALVRVRILMN